MPRIPIVCTLTPETARTRRAALLPGLALRASQREETADGYRFVFPASTEMLRAITEVIDAERQCCRWLNIRLEVRPDLDGFVLDLSGPAGAREFLAALFGE